MKWLVPVAALILGSVAARGGSNFAPGGQLRPISTLNQANDARAAYDQVRSQSPARVYVREIVHNELAAAPDGGLDGAPYRPAPRLPLQSLAALPGLGTLAVAVHPISGLIPSGYETQLIRLWSSCAKIAATFKPSWLSSHDLSVVIGLLLTLVVAMVALSWVLERKIRRHTTALAYLEQRRSRILEDINSSRPLAQIIEEITEVVSYKLHGAACWCQITDGARLGNRPSKLTSLRMIQQEIPARSGGTHGTIFAALHAHMKPSEEETEALSAAVRLAALAIETARLYSDLVHRSEFDLLTDIPNRFSMERYLDKLIQDARQTAGVFGLIYIDLDDLKRVNDEYGHKTGDIYLKEAARRMKRQLRPGDMLARLGGDEFAVLVPAVRKHSDVEEIAQRLEHSFDDPFEAENQGLKGSASIGVALYPEDATTKDSLLSAADAAMYVTKHTKQRTRQAAAENANPELTAGEHI